MSDQVSDVEQVAEAAHLLRHPASYTALRIQSGCRHAVPPTNDCALKPRLGFQYHLHAASSQDEWCRQPLPAANTAHLSDNVTDKSNE